MAYRYPSFGVDGERNKKRYTNAVSVTSRDAERKREKNIRLRLRCFYLFSHCSLSLRLDRRHFQSHRLSLSNSIPNSIFTTRKRWCFDFFFLSLSSSFRCPALSHTLVFLLSFQAFLPRSPLTTLHLFRSLLLSALHSLHE